MGVSKNRGTPKSSILIRVFHYKPSILGYPCFWKHPHDFLIEVQRDQLCLAKPPFCSWIDTFCLRQGIDTRIVTSSSSAPTCQRFSIWSLPAVSCNQCRRPVQCISQYLLYLKGDTRIKDDDVRTHSKIQNGLWNNP